MSDRQFTAVVLAADRTAGDPVSIAAGSTCKAFVPVRGTPMIIRVLDALEGSGMIARITICGPPDTVLDQCPELVRRIDAGRVEWLPNQDTPASSAESCLRRLGRDQPVLLTTADHALLTSEMVSHFLAESTMPGADSAVGLVDYATVSRAFPGARRTVTRLRDGAYCGCNLYALLNGGGHDLVSLWKQVEQERKKPWKWISGLLGMKTVIAYLLGRLTLEQGLSAISARTGIRVRAVILPFPSAGIDVDSAGDLRLVESIVQQEQAGGKQQACSRGDTATPPAGRGL